MGKDLDENKFKQIIQMIELGSKEEVWWLILTRALWEYGEKHNYTYLQIRELCQAIHKKILTN